MAFVPSIAMCSQYRLRWAAPSLREIKRLLATLNPPHLAPPLPLIHVVHVDETLVYFCKNAPSIDGRLGETSATHSTAYQPHAMSHHIHLPIQTSQLKHQRNAHTSPVRQHHAPHLLPKHPKSSGHSLATSPSGRRFTRCHSVVCCRVT